MPRIYAPNLFLCVLQESKVDRTLLLVGLSPILFPDTFVKPLPRLLTPEIDTMVITLVKSLNGWQEADYVACFATGETVISILWFDDFTFEGWHYSATKSGRIYRKGLVGYGK